MAKAELVKKTKVDREDGYIYYVDDDGHIARKKETDEPGKKSKFIVVKKVGITKESGYAYFVDEAGDIRRAYLDKVEVQDPPDVVKPKVKKLRKK